MKKQGFTLVELIAVIGVMAIILGFTVVMFTQLFDFQQNNEEYTEGVRAADRLVAEFRSDVRTYGKPEIPSDGKVLLRWKTESETIDYMAEPGEFPDQLNVIRTVRKEGQQILYEVYRLPERSVLHFVDGTDSDDTGKDAGLVALSLWITPKGIEAPKPDGLNPFDRTLPPSLEKQVDPKYAGNWRTIVVRY